MCAEAHDVNSGFGRYTKEILSRLYANPNYEIAEFSCYFNEGKTKTVPWKVYANSVDESHKDSGLYKQNPLNQFGLWRFEKTVLHFKPDIVFDIRDYWMFAYQELTPLRKYFNWVIVPTIDSIPQRPEWIQTFSNSDALLTHTDWAANYIKSLDRPINLTGCASDSVDSDVFKPVGWTKSYHKAKYGISPKSFVIGSVMRNQKRKLIPELFYSLKKVIQQTGNRDIYLYLHTSYPELQGWNLPELLQEYGVYNNVLFTYYCVASKQILVSTYKGPSFLNENDQQCLFPNVVNGVSNDQLRDIYNLFDIYVQYAICEGLGIPQLEAASCGIPLFAVNYSGMDEITSKVEGIKIDCLLSKELETGSDRATPDNKHLISQIIEWSKKPKSELRAKSKRTRELLLGYYNWEKTAISLMETFDKLEPKNNWNEPLRFNTSLSVPINLPCRDFIYFVVDNILMEPALKSTYYIQSMIKNLDELTLGLNNDIVIQKKQEVLKSLESYMNNKMTLEELRSKPELLNQENFLNV